MLERILRSPIVMIVMLIYLGIFYVGIQEGWPFNFLIYPFIIIFVGYFGLLFIHNKKYPNRKIKFISFIPYELREEDEGLQWITYKATRKVYIFYYYAIPFGIVFVTFFQPFIPYFPIWLLVAFGVIQYLIYWFEMKKILKEEDV
ncbi:hypothetical protein ACFSKI_06380 [Pseudogracilibacillus auburnensis]|uniref:Uncharacterized protein n=1 Tax=Pseudogracilibacillus auburnensis TaxID=1494959 RepID=A0A2V3W2W1_9BACI|nr:hypothetical protein [Pseudogracilibacillus auburnensis]MBO1002206.1 hypothetical protein [Pseudogracilibacillus auburnensis]PXW87534.1 hypothetical protein DFR56_105178 [Pseudogracilibacillus auburnensis]